MFGVRPSRRIAERCIAHTQIARLHPSFHVQTLLTARRLSHNDRGVITRLDHNPAN